MRRRGPACSHAMVTYRVPTAPVYAFDVIRGYACAYDAHGNRIPSTTRVYAHTNSRTRLGSQAQCPVWSPGRPTSRTILDEIYATGDPVNESDPTGMCNKTGNGNAWDLFNPWSTNNPVRCSVEKGPNSSTSKILKSNPAYQALTGFHSEYQASQSPCASNWTIAGDALRGVLGTIGTGLIGSGVESAGSGIAGLLGAGAGEAMTGTAVEEIITSLPEGTGDTVFTVSNSSELQALFDELSQGGVNATPASYNGEMVDLPDGTKVEFRPTSTSGGPTIDSRLPTGLKLKVYVTPWPPVG